MPQYLLTVNHPADYNPPAAEMTQIVSDVEAVNQKLTADGVFVFAGGLAGPDSSTVVDARSGSPVVTDGPYLETKEYMGGFWIIEVADFDAALAWAKLAAPACRLPIEIRPFMSEPPKGA